MNKVEIIKAISGDEKILAYIQTQSWKTAFHHILSAEELEKSTNIDNVEEMYRKVLSHGIVHLEIELVDEKPYCIAGWSQNRNQLGSETAELICIHSLENQRRQGYGSVMMKHLLHSSRRCYLRLQYPAGLRLKYQHCLQGLRYRDCRKDILPSPKDCFLL